MNEIPFSFDAELSQLKQLIGDDNEMIVSFIEPFLEELTEYKTTIPADLAQSKMDDVGRAFHSLKTNAKVFGSLSLAEICTRMEHDVRIGSYDNVTAGMPVFQDHLEKFYQKLTDKLSSLATA